MHNCDNHLDPTLELVLLGVMETVLVLTFAHQ
jgi:hypothetical protein